MSWIRRRVPEAGPLVGRPQAAGGREAPVSAPTLLGFLTEVTSDTGRTLRLALLLCVPMSALGVVLLYLKFDPTRWAGAGGAVGVAIITMIVKEWRRGPPDRGQPP